LFRDFQASLRQLSSIADICHSYADDRV